jgi:hypothetical protein
MYEQFGTVAKARLFGRTGQLLTGEVKVQHQHPGPILDVVVDIWNAPTGVYGVHLLEGQTCAEILAADPKPSSEWNEDGSEGEAENPYGSPVANLMISTHGRGHLEATVAPYVASERNLQTVIRMALLVRRIDVNETMAERMGCADLTPTPAVAHNGRAVQPIDEAPANNSR